MRHHETIETTDHVIDIRISDEEYEIGSDGPFYAVYQSDDERYGWFCTNCGTLDVAMDTMGRIVCNVCGNTRKATRWDAAYL